MTESPDDLTGALLDAAARVLEAHDPGELGQCLDPQCVAAGLPGRCHPYRMADEVLGTWANRVHATPPRVVGPDEVDVVNNLRPGQSVISGVPVVVQANGEVRYHPAGTRLVRAGDGHPSWCAGLSCAPTDGDEGGGHVSPPDRVANLLIMLMHIDGDAPMVTLMDLTEPSDEVATVAVPATYAGSLAHAVRALGLRATTAD